MWTDKHIRALKPRDKTYQLSENTRERGTGRLVLQVEPTGIKRFYFQYFLNGSRNLVQIGKLKQNAVDSGYSLSEARVEKSKLANLYMREGDVKVYLNNIAREEASKKEAIEKQGTMEDLVHCYLKDMQARGKRTSDRVVKAINLYVFDPFPNLRSKPAKDVSVEDVKIILRRMVKKGIKTQTNKVRSHLHTIFQYGLRHDHDYEFDKRSTLFDLQFNPVAATQRKNHFDGIGQHVISERDIHKFWKLSKLGMNPVSALAIKLCFATGGQRPGELIKCPWLNYDFDKKLLTIPAHISKNGLDHIVPLSGPAIRLLIKLQELTGHLEFPFSGLVNNTYANQPMRSDSLSKALYRFCEKHKDNDDGELNIEKFIPRDIRRTCKTLMGAAGISKEIRDHLQNHAMRSDVSSKHYDRYDYLAEKQEAIRIWNTQLLRITVAPENVVKIRAKAGKPS